jgi:flagellar assembly protein FliH
MASTFPNNSVRKFDFGERFDEPDQREDAPEPPKYGENELAAARDAGRAEGFNEGQIAAETSLAAQIVQMLDSTGTAIANLLAERERLHQELAGQNVRTVIAILDKAIPELAHRHALIEIEGLVRTCLGELYDEPRIVIRAADQIIDALQVKVDRIAASCGFTGKIALLGDPTMAATDCRVEWADGGAERSFSATWQTIANAMQQGMNDDTSTATRRADTPQL